MKKWVCMLMASAGALAGCQSEHSQPTGRASVLDVSGPAQGYPADSGYTGRGVYPMADARSGYQMPSVTPPPQPAVQPMPSVQPMPAIVETQTPAIPASASNHGNKRVAAGGSQYTVKPGDTLYHIAKVQYGDGKQWQRIAGANPGVSPTALKVGQVLVMP